VTFKKERLNGARVSFYKKAFLKKSHFIAYASESDFEMGRIMSKNSCSYDFRMEQIRRRLTYKKEKFSRLFTDYEKYKSFIETFPRDKRLIFGNVWSEDFFLLENAPSDTLIVIVPHQLSEGNIKLMIDQLPITNYQINLYTILELAYLHQKQEFQSLKFHSSSRFYLRMFVDLSSKYQSYHHH
jgi:hypothetical protein